MFYNLLRLSIGVLVSTYVYGQDELRCNARSVGLSGISTALTDEWSCKNNQAGLAFYQKKKIGINCDDRYMLSEISTQTVMTSMPAGAGEMASSFIYFGCRQYNEENICVAYGRVLLKWFGAGIAINYFRYSLEATGEKASAITGDIGILAIPFDELRIGLQTINISQSRFHNSARRNIPSGLKLGVSYSEKDENYLVGVQMDWENYNFLNIRIGAEYLILKSLFIRFGVKLPNNSSYSLGLGTHLKRTEIDLGFEQHTCLGLSSSLSWIIQLGKND
jgi:hypothetical protein